MPNEWRLICVYAKPTGRISTLVASTNVICQTKTDTNLSILCMCSHPKPVYICQVPTTISIILCCQLLDVACVCVSSSTLFPLVPTHVHHLLVSFTITSNEFPALPTPYLTLISLLSNWIRFTPSHIQFHFCYWLVQYACIHHYCAICLQISKCLVQ